jgi:hypothetical protein
MIPAPQTTAASPNTKRCSGMICCTSGMVKPGNVRKRTSA